MRRRNPGAVSQEWLQPRPLIRVIIAHKDGRPREQSRDILQPHPRIFNDPFQVSFSFPGKLRGKYLSLSGMEHGNNWQLRAGNLDRHGLEARYAEDGGPKAVAQAFGEGDPYPQTGKAPRSSGHRDTPDLLNTPIERLEHELKGGHEVDKMAFSFSHDMLCRHIPLQGEKGE